MNGVELPHIKINVDGNGTPVNASAEKPAEGDSTTKKTGADKSSGEKGAEQPL
jgi:hypothetical protein